MNRGIARLQDERVLPRELEESINGGFNKAIKRIMDTNDSYGSRVMREVILDEVNELRRAVLDLVKRIYRGNSDNSRLLAAEAADRTATAGSVRHRH